MSLSFVRGRDASLILMLFCLELDCAATLSCCSTGGSVRSIPSPVSIVATSRSGTAPFVELDELREAAVAPIAEPVVA